MNADDKITINIDDSILDISNYVSDLTSENIVFDYSTYSSNIMANTISTDTGKSIRYSSDVNFEGDLILKGKNLSETLSTIEKRLSILVPDPSKLEKYEALKKAYENYKLLESLLYEDSPNKPK